MTKKIALTGKMRPAPMRRTGRKAEPGPAAGQDIAPLVQKEIKWMGDAKDVISAFPDEVKQAGGEELFRVQCGPDPNDSAPMGNVGKGTFEIRINKAGGWFRIFYVAKFANAVYVLHAFQKKTNATAKGDMDVGRTRYTLAAADAKSVTAALPKPSPTKAKD